MATHSSILAWEISRTEKPCRLWLMGSQRVGHDWVRAHTHTKYSFKFGVAKIQQNFLSSEAISKMATRWKSHYKNVTGNAFIFLRVCLCVCVFIRERKGERRKRGKEKESHLLGLVFMLSLCFSSLPLFSLPLFLISFHS